MRKNFIIYDNIILELFMYCFQVLNYLKNVDIFNKLGNYSWKRLGI